MAPMGKAELSSVPSTSAWRGTRPNYRWRIVVVFAILALSFALTSNTWLGLAVSNMKHSIALALGILSCKSSSYGVYDLTNAKWTLSDTGNNISVPATIPSQVN
jgi:hypothetical protein